MVFACVRHRCARTGSCEASSEERGNLTAVLSHVWHSGAGTRTRRGHPCRLRGGHADAWRVIVVRLDLVCGAQVDVREGATVVAGDAIGVKVAVKIVPTAAGPENEEEEGGEDGSTGDAADDTSDDGARM